jgi:Ca-activated chloride channel family protein
MRRYLALAVLLLLAGLACASPSAQAGLGTVSGILRNGAGAPMPAVRVSLIAPTGRVLTATSDSNGAFTFTALTPGRYTVSIARTGLVPLSRPVVVSAGSTRQLDLTLLTVEEQTSKDERDNAARESRAPARQRQPLTYGVAGGRTGAEVGIAPPAASTAMPYGAAMRAAQPFNTETYGRIEDNQWNVVNQKPLSTFSIDVDTASYSNVRRYLKEGQRPPKDAVRVEELINYFSYDYAEPKGNEPFSIVTSIGEAPWNRRHRLALIGLQARHLDASKLPPRNLVFLIDVSGSMEAPDKLPLVTASLAMLARNLTDNDHIAIVVYAGAAGLVLPSTSGGDTSTILSALSQLRAGGSTNGAGGIALAYQIARQQFVKGGVNRVILATDGDFNVGTTSEGDLTRLIEQQRATGINLSVLGFGMGNLKDSTMEALADHGDGNYAYIDSMSEAQKVLVEQAGGTLVTTAKDVKLQVEFNPRTVAAYRLIGYENRVLQDQDFNNDKKDAGDMGAGHSVTALYELVPAGEPMDVPGIDPLKYQRPSAPADASSLDEAMTVKVRYKAPGGDVSKLTAVVVRTQTAESPALGFASAVAEFGMLLRESEFKGSASFADVRSRAIKFKGADAHGHRAEFIRLIDAAETVAHMHKGPRIVEADSPVR